jgi:hypothetical protein
MLQGLRTKDHTWKSQRLWSIHHLRDVRSSRDSNQGERR